MEKIKIGQRFNLGEITLSEEDIIEFAKQFDPLELHTDREAASKTMFGGLIASGPHIFNVFYKKGWIPLFGKTVVCGLGVYNWKFIKPVYPDRKISCEISVGDIRPDEKLNAVAVSWLFEFKNEKGEMVQVLQTDVMHRF